MIVGDKSKLAIESGISCAYERLSFRALGYFLIHINGIRYGIDAPDATMLACSFDEVRERINRRGTHSATFAKESNATKIADAVNTSLYLEEQEQCFFGLPCSELRRIVYSNKLLWVPDGDEAFDDGSRILHFDIDNRVRLLGFKPDRDINRLYHCLTDIWLDADQFYTILQRWYDAFEHEWEMTPHTAE